MSSSFYIFKLNEYKVMKTGAMRKFFLLKFFQAIMIFLKNKKK